MKPQLLLFFLGSMLALNSQGQHVKVTPDLGASTTTQAQFTKSEEISKPCLGLRRTQDISEQWFRQISSGNVTHGGSGQSHDQLIKQQKTELKFGIQSLDNPTQENANAAAVEPTLGTNFLGNEMFGGTPPDNSMAVSNDGIIVSCDNATIEVYDGEAQNPYLSSYVSHSDFFNFLNPTPTGNIYDPKVIYDSGADRFIYVILHGTSSAQSELLLCFSQSNNPANDGWWVYRIPANPAHANAWFDYPNIGVSNNEVYVSGNMFTDAGNFTGNILFQIEKNACFSGGNINYQYWADVADNNGELGFAMVPLSYGQQGNYGPGVYVVANETSEPSDRKFIFDLTNDMSASNETINFHNVSTSAFDVGGNAAQNGSSILLDVGDNRIINGFYLDGVVHTVFTSDIGQGWNGITYDRTFLNNLTNTRSTYELQGTFDYCYPAVASSAASPNSQSVIIGFLRSGQTVFPEVRAVNCDHDMQWSNSIQIKQGQDFVNIQGTGTDRWGDYSGISRRNAGNQGAVWMSGCYGQSGNNFNVNNGWNTWVAELSDGWNPFGVEENEITNSIRVYPNPTVDRFSISFELEERTQVTITIVDGQGKVVKELLNDSMKPTAHVLHFNRKALSSGIYSVIIKTPKTILKNEKLIIN